MKRKLFNYLLYISLIFLGVYLYRLDYFAFKEVAILWFPLVISTILLWTGYLLSAVSWWKILHKHSIIISVRMAVVSHGLAIFAKYIPGKIWVILGRAGYVSKYTSNLKTTSFLSLKEQLIYVWEGLLISSIPMLVIYGLNYYTAAVLMLCLGLTLFLFTEKVHNLFLTLFLRITKKPLDIPYLQFRENYGIIAYVFMYWIAWLIGFYFFVEAFHPASDFSIAFAFPLSVTIGLLAILFPGGLGVREAILTGYMVLSGIPLTVATVISIYARLWFMSGEVFIFLTALITSVLFKEKNR
ncbi:MAG: hypothetical protein KDC05_06580 [Bacteroidales bacterium]|nr:hypothetical protein [Bacteroidales bacterium]